MSDLEDRLRAELWAQAQRTQPEDLRNLRVPARRPARARRGGAGRRTGRYTLWLAPVAAALAVIGVIAGVRLSVPGPPARPAAPSAAAGLPRYYLEIGDGGIAKPVVTVRRSADAAAVSQFSVPGVVLGDAATADDRTFILTGSSQPFGTTPTSFYRLTLSSSGDVRRLRQLNVHGLDVPAGPHGYYAGSLALTPDGQTLAFAVNPSGEEAEVVSGRARVEVVSLRTGAAIRTWTAPSLYDVSDLSWAGGTQALQFLTTYERTGGPYQNTLRRLNLSRRDASLLGASRPVPVPASAGQVTSALAADHGRVVLAWTSPPADAEHHPVGSVLSEYSARTGRRLQVLMTMHSRSTFGGNGELWSADPSGRHLIIGGTDVTGVRMVSVTTQVAGRKQVVREPAPVTRTIFGRLDNGRFTPLPDPAGRNQSGAW